MVKERSLQSLDDVVYVWDDYLNLLVWIINEKMRSFQANYEKTQCPLACMKNE